MARELKSVREWLRDRGATADKSLLNPETYPGKELRKDKIKLERQRKQLKTELTEHRQRYREILEEAAEASKTERRTLAKRAKLEKRKFELKQKRLSALDRRFAATLAIEAAREVLTETSESGDLALDSVVGREEAADGFQTHFVERMAKFDVDVDDETAQVVAEELGIDFGETDTDDVGEVQSNLMESMVDYSIDTTTMDAIQDGLDADIAAPDPPNSLEEFPDLGDSDGERDDDPYADDSPIHSPSESADGPLGAESDIDVTLRRPTDDLVETVLELGHNYLVCSMYGDHYAVTWEAPIGVEEFLDIETPHEGAGDLPVEVYFDSTTIQDAERLRCPLSKARDDDRFPGLCGFLAVDFGDYELTWEREGTHTDGHELTAAVDGYDEQPFRTVFLRSLEGEFDETKLTELLGRLAESLETDPPSPASNGGDS